MVTSTRLNWDAVLNELMGQIVQERPELNRLVRARRIHVDAFHKDEWPRIQVRLQKEFGIFLTDDEEPHWMEPWKAAYWHPSTNFSGVRTWSLTKPISADAASIAHYYAKGWRTRKPEEEVAAAPVETVEEIKPPLYVSDKPKSPRNKRPRGRSRRAQ